MSPPRGSKSPLSLGFSTALRRSRPPHVLREPTFPPELCLLSENPGRAYRRCLARGTWQTLANRTVWQDDSECSENHSFQANVSPLGSVRTHLGPNRPALPQALHGPPWPLGFRGHTESPPQACLLRTHFCCCSLSLEYLSSALSWLLLF